MILVALLCASPAHAGDEGAGSGEWFAHAYVGQASSTRFNQLVFLNKDFMDTWLGAAGIGRRFAEAGARSHFEWEVQAAKHWGLQDHWETNAIVMIRRRNLSWGAMRNSVAFGTGASYAFERPAIEDLGPDVATYGLQFLLLEVTATWRPREPWSLFTRIHHRSGTFGLVAESTGASNFVTLGLRKHF